MQRSIVLYGNCQADALSTVLRADPVISQLFRIVYVRSFEHPTDGAPAAPPPEEVADCAILLEQHDRNAFPYRDLLPDGCAAVKFPALDLNVLWPLNCENPYNVPEPPLFPYGRFWYGDSVILRAVQKGMDADAALDYYLNGWDSYAIDLARLLAIEKARLTARDARCDIKGRHLVLDAFSKRRLFWAINHPTSELLLSLAELLIAQCARVEPAVEDADIAETLRRKFPARGPLGAVSIPIHPKVAEFFELSWYDPAEKFRTWDGSEFTYEEYFKRMIDAALEFRAQRAPA